MLIPGIEDFYLCQTQARDCRTRYYNYADNLLVEVSHPFGTIVLVNNPKECYKKVTNKKLDVNDLVKYISK